MKLVFVLVDALRSSYLSKESMPFLFSLSKKGRYIKKVIASPGFCERSEIFSGLDCYDSGNFGAIGYDPGVAVYSKSKALSIAKILSRVSERRTRQLFVRYRLKAGKRLNPYRIPFGSLANFFLTEDGPRQLVNHSEIVDVLKENNKSCTFDFFTSLADLRPRTKMSIEDFLNQSIKDDKYFIPLYYGKIDAMGHLYGNDVLKMQPYLHEIDSLLKKLYENATAKGYSFAVLGDHGMVPVTKRINVISALNETNLKLHRDYEMFIDSTCARFWFFDKDAKDILEKTIQRFYEGDGCFINSNNAKENRIPLDLLANDGRPVYGELIWFVNPGVLISPDFFHSEKEQINGMHGYLKTEMDTGTGLFIATKSKYSNDVIEEAPLHSICKELCSLLEIEIPNSNWVRQINTL